MIKAVEEILKRSCHPITPAEIGFRLGVSIEETLITLEKMKQRGSIQMSSIDQYLISGK